MSVDFTPSTVTQSTGRPAAAESEWSATPLRPVAHWVVLPDGTLHVAVIDIMGKGVAATKDALAVTHALRLLALDGCPLETLVSRADELALASRLGASILEIFPLWSALPDPRPLRDAVADAGPILPAKVGARWTVSAATF